jgi:hypothetical protein
VYRDKRYVVDLRPSLQAPCGEEDCNRSTAFCNCFEYRSRCRSGGSVGIPKGFPHSVISMAKCWINDMPPCSAMCPHPPRDARQSLSLVNECIGDFALIEKAVANQLPAISCPDNRLHGQVKPADRPITRLIVPYTHNIMCGRKQSEYTCMGPRRDAAFDKNTERGRLGA